jgi:hypothetical protein
LGDPSLDRYKENWEAAITFACRTHSRGLFSIRMVARVCAMAEFRGSVIGAGPTVMEFTD